MSLCALGLRMTRGLPGRRPPPPPMFPGPRLAAPPQPSPEPARGPPSLTRGGGQCSGRPAGQNQGRHAQEGDHPPRPAANPPGHVQGHPSSAAVRPASPKPPGGARPSARPAPRSSCPLAQPLRRRSPPRTRSPATRPPGRVAREHVGPPRPLLARPRSGSAQFSNSRA